MQHLNFSTWKRLWVILPAYAWLILFFLLPFILVILISFSEVRDSIPPYELFMHFNDGKFSINPYLDNYKLIFKDQIYILAYIDAVKLALISTIIALIIGYPIAYGIYRAHKKMKPILLALLIIPFWTSSLIRVYAWISLLRMKGLINQLLLSAGFIDEPLRMMNTEFAAIIGIVYSYLPFMVLPIYSILERLNISLIEAAMDLGCTTFRAFMRVTLPLSMPGIISGCVLMFIPAVGEFVIPDLLGGSQVVTIGKVIWNEFFLNRDWPVASAITTIMTLAVIIPIMVIQRVLVKRADR
jgi:putrescine transport system permease protein